MQRIADSILFQFGDNKFSWLDAFLFAFASGDFSEFEHTLWYRLGLEPLGAEPGIEELERGMDRFRKAHGLYSANQIDAWVKLHQVSSAELNGFIRRTVLQEQRSALSQNTTHTAEDAEFRAAALVEGVCSHAFQQFGEALAQGLAAGEILRERLEQPAVVPAPHLEETQAFLTRCGLNIPEDLPPRMARITGAISSLQHIRRQSQPSREIEQCIQQRERQWTKIHCCTAVFPDLEAARDTVTFVRREGADLAKLGQSLSAAVGERNVCSSDLGAEFGEQVVQAILAAKPSELIGPFECADRFLLLQVREKDIPSPKNATVRERARQELTDAAIDKAVKRFISWNMEAL